MNKTHWQDWVSTLVGIWLFATPLIFGGESAVVWNFLIVGALVTALALSEFSVFNRFSEWAIAALGTWMMLAPRIMDFASETLTWNAVICGAVLIALAGWAVGDAHEILPKIKRPKGDLRGDMQGVAVPDEHEHMAGARTRRPDEGPGIVGTGVGVQSPGQGSHE